MLIEMTEEDRALDALWREKFGEPLPILGAGVVIKAVLGDPQERSELEAA